jgi:hypothetical protein
MGGRVSLTPRPALPREPELVAGMLGHLPGRVRLERLRAGARAAMRAAGWGDALDHLDDPHPGRLSGEEVARVRALEHVPVPLESSAELDDIFPDARSLDTGYDSLLAGARAWLPRSVDDYFANGGERLWIVRIPESSGREGFRAHAERTGAAGVLPLEHPLALRGLAALLPIPEVAVVAAPDLERLMIPRRLPDIPRLRLANPEPGFTPCGTRFDDGHRERRRSAEMPDPAEPDATLDWLAGVRSVLARLRPDVQYLHCLPLQYADSVQGPGVHSQVVARLDALRRGRPGADLRRVQLLFPYLRRPVSTGSGADLASPVGSIAGCQAAVARRQGPWRSAAGVSLVTDAVPYPPCDARQELGLRERPGVGVLIRRQGRVELADERLAVPALHPDDWSGARDPARFDGYRSGEIARFVGWLLRRLRRLGETLVFDLDPRDPRPRLLLEELFGRLHAAGALRGAVPEESFSIRPGERRDNAIAYDIEIAPAFPIDRLRLTFANSEGEWRGWLTGAAGEVPRG